MRSLQAYICDDAGTITRISSQAAPELGLFTPFDDLMVYFASQQHAESEFHVQPPSRLPSQRDEKLDDDTDDEKQNNFLSFANRPKYF